MKNLESHSSLLRDTTKSFNGLSILLTALCTCFLTSCGSNDDNKAQTNNNGGTVRYTALGASDATGVGATPLTNGYVYLIKEGIENEGRSTALSNYGIPGIEIGGILDVELKLLDAASKPDVITLFTGGNDIVGGASESHFEMDLEAILNHLQQIEGARVFVADLPDLTQLPRFQDDPDPDITTARVRAFNEIIQRQVSSHGATLIRLSSEPANTITVSEDGFHPNDRGHRRIADLFLQEILPAVIE